ncbi:MAG: molybdopterin-dependent oxidoreductase [Armatimonadetes bacterium]|nr:molybdopterin-dependent oxidoreductase [Armatimonadota bacterium]
MTHETPEMPEAKESLASHAPDTSSKTSLSVEAQMRRVSRRSFLWAGGAIASVIGFREWLASRPQVDGIPYPFRRTLQFNEKVGRALFRPTSLAPTFPANLAGEPRANGGYGLQSELDIDNWDLSVEGGYGSKEPLSLTLKDIKSLPRVEMTTELKCIEGWSQVVTWAGVRLSDFMTKHPPMPKNSLPPDIVLRPQDLPDYVGLATPDGEYYVGLDRESALHPQTLLCYEMNGKPLTKEHGAPLRLVIPVKYGIKNIKRIGVLRYTNERPADYWAEAGYDWYSGL